MTSSRIGLVMLLLGISCAARAQDPHALLVQANLAYQQGRVEEAKTTYEQIVRLGYDSGELFYNLGNAYYRTGNIPRAVLNYERAARIMPNDDDLRHNLRLASLMAVDRIEPAPRLFLWDWWDGVKSWFSITSAGVVMLLLFALTCGALAVVLLARTYALRRIAALVVIVIGFFFLFSVIVVAGKTFDLGRDDEAVVLAQIATVKNSPDEKGTDAFVLHGGVKVTIIDRLNTWMKIRLADGKVGWMASSAAETI
jgi:tetratricopeptide (TPR) repeat protein